MATPVDAAAAAAQIISLAFQTFQGCIEAYKFCHTAQRIGNDGDLIRTKLQIERARLEDWAKRTRLTSSQPDDRLNWALIRNILQQQHILLTSGEKLKKRYHLDLPEEVVDDDGEDEKKSVSQSGIERYLAATRPDLYTKASRVIQSRNSPLKRLRWAAAGRDKVIKVVDDLASLNGQLERLLEAADRQWMRSGMDSLLRDLLSRSTSLAEVESVDSLLHPSTSSDDRAIAAAADFKRMRLTLGIDKRDDEVRPTPSRKTAYTLPTLKMLKEKKLAFSGASGYDGLVSATYDERPVLIEWRKAEDARYILLKQHMQGLALLLGNADASFATLHCIGLLGLEKRGRFGLVYEAPILLDTPKTAEHDTRTLFDLLSEQSRLSLAQRLRISVSVAEASLQLHTAGWLHKNIRSENVLFVAAKEHDAETFLNSRPYLVGYELARPDDNETAGALTEVPDTPLLTDLYRHPEKRGPTSTSYRKQFDLYALACLLTELALWEPLASVFSRHDEKDWKRLIAEAEASKKDLKLPSLAAIVETPAFCRDINHSVGPTYLQAIQQCLSSPDRAPEDDEVSLVIQRGVVEKLRACKV